jgi:hypothetical protein
VASGTSEDQVYLGWQVLEQKGEGIVNRFGINPAIPNEKQVVTNAQRSVILGHQTQGGNHDDQTDQNGPDH